MRRFNFGIIGWLAAVVGLTLAVSPVLAQPEGMDENVSIRAVAQRSVVKAGGRVVVAVEMQHRDRWHSWPVRGTVMPKGAENVLYSDLLFATEQPPAWVKLDGVQWPTPHNDKVANPDGGPPISAPVYSGTVVIFARLEIAADAKPGDAVIPLLLSYQSCNDQSCALPSDVALDVPVKIVAAGESDEAKDNEPSLFAKFDGTKWGSSPPGATSTPDKPDGSATATGSAPTSAPATSKPAGPQVVELNDFGAGISIDPSTPTGFALIILLALVGGFLLNLMPCVLPVIPIKILSLSKSAGNPRRCFYLGSIAALGVIAAWLIVGVLSSLAGSAASQIYGYWWFSAGIGLFIAIMSVSMLGLFTINLPQSVYMVNTSTDTARGSFIFGMFTVVLAVPCIAPFGGAAVGWAISQPMLTVLMVFLAVGVGMASPYLVLSARPKLISWIPRTGPASELVKQVMGGLMLAMGVYFIGSGLLGLIAEYPYLSKVLHWWIIAIVAGLTVLWMIVRTFQITRSPAKRVIFTIIGLALIAMPVYFANQLTGVQHRLYLAKLKDQQAAAGTGLWRAYNAEALAEARKSGKVVVVDFTADWCLTCQFLKATVLSTEPVEKVLRSDDVVSLLADLTSKKAPGNKLLRDLGAGGIPLLVIYSPGSDQPTFRSSGYTAEQLIKAVDDGLAARTAWLKSKTTTQTGWQDYSQDAFSAAQARGDVVVVDFAADWDLTSYVSLKLLSEEKPEVNAATARAGVTRLFADVSRRNAPGNTLMKDVGATGIPLVLVYKRGDPIEAPSFRSGPHTPENVENAVTEALLHEQHAREAAPGSFSAPSSG